MRRGSRGSAGAVERGRWGEGRRSDLWGRLVIFGRRCLSLALPSQPRWLSLPACLGAESSGVGALARVRVAASINAVAERRVSEGEIGGRHRGRAHERRGLRARGGPGLTGRAKPCGADGQDGPGRWGGGWQGGGCGLWSMDAAWNRVTRHGQRVATRESRVVGWWWSGTAAPPVPTVARPGIPPPARRVFYRRRRGGGGRPCSWVGASAALEGAGVTLGRDWREAVFYRSHAGVGISRVLILGATLVPCIAGYHDQVYKSDRSGQTAALR